MDRFDCYGHQLDLQRHGNEIIAACHCGRWRHAVPLADESDLRALVARLVGEHYRHVDGWPRAWAQHAIGDRLAVLPEGPQP
jgi:hypothetical protein